MSKIVKSLDSCDKEGQYRIIWKIENFDLFSEKYRSLKSPVFVVNASRKTDWVLNLHHRGSFFSLFLQRNWCDKGPEFVTVSYKLSNFKIDGSAESDEDNNYKFKNGWVSPKCLIIHLVDLNNYLLNDTLTVCCEICTHLDVLELSDAGEISAAGKFLEKDCVPFSISTFSPEIHTRVWKDLIRAKERLYRYPNECVARTRFHKETMTLAWRITEFSSYQSDQKDSFLVLPGSKLGTSFLITAHFKDDPPEDSQIQIGISLIEKCTNNPIFVICKLSMLDIYDKPKSLAEGQYTFEHSRKVSQETQSALPNQLDSQYEYRVWNFANFKRSVPFKNKFMYLQNDILSLRFDLIISNGVKSSEIEESKYLSLLNSNPVCGDYTRTNTLSDDLMCLCSENRFCDVSLRVGGEIFPTHKVVLCARSPVFSAMFEYDMTEKSTGVVDIVDMDAQTLRLMLMFMYSETLTELETLSALKLYRAADKYQFHLLKEKCASFLVANISVSNVCDILVFADLHHDKNMKMNIIEYICNHANEIILSDSWKDFMISNMHLAGEAMHYVLTKRLNS